MNVYDMTIMYIEATLSMLKSMDHKEDENELKFNISYLTDVRDNIDNLIKKLNKHS